MRSSRRRCAAVDYTTDISFGGIVVVGRRDDQDEMATKRVGICEGQGTGHNCSAAVTGYGTRPWTSCSLDLTSLVAGHAASPVALVVGTTFAFRSLGIKDVEARSAGRPSLT